jgi:predicted transcriptional regulator
MTTNTYRGRYMIIAQMLSTINDSGTEGVTKTSIMYKAFLSYAQLKEYLSFMVEKSLIEEVPKQIRNNRGNEKFVYKITGKGLRLLQISKEIESLVGLD